MPVLHLGRRRGCVLTQSKHLTTKLLEQDPEVSGLRFITKKESERPQKVGVVIVVSLVGKRIHLVGRR
jgi:hypothetical protein